MIEKLIQILGPEKVSIHEGDLLAYSRDMWPKTLLWQRRNFFPYRPDAVVWPEREEEILGILELANQEAIPIIPWGGGSGVCGGCIPLKGGIALDLKRLNSIIEIDRVSHLVRAEAGIMGENLERALNLQGFSLGHFPSSIYCSTLGGWLSTRAAGQLSSKYGKIEDMVTSLRILLPTGEVLNTPSAPRMATGPDLAHLFLGSEGVLGVITSAELAIHPIPPHREFLSGCFPNLDQALEGVRTILQRGIRPAALRLYDGLDTVIAFHKSSKSKKEKNPLYSFVEKKAFQFLFSHPSFLNRLGSVVGTRCLLITTFEGLPRISRAEREAARETLSPFSFEEFPGMAEHWWDHRYDVSYKQSPVFHQGAFVDTMEVSASWKNLAGLYDQIKKALTPLAFVMAHFSHGYSTGNTIYFTFGAYRSDPEELEKLYDQIWETGLKACLKAGGAISHHHGIGLSKSQFLRQFWGDKLFDLFGDFKKKVDPKNIMNPGKLGLS